VTKWNVEPGIRAHEKVGKKKPHFDAVGTRSRYTREVCIYEIGDAAGSVQVTCEDRYYTKKRRRSDRGIGRKHAIGEGRASLILIYIGGLSCVQEGGGGESAEIERDGKGKDCFQGRGLGVCVTGD
jgi:hypothetical protein